MIKQVESRKLYIAIADIKDGKISYAKLNNFVVKLGEHGDIRMYNENNKNIERDVPLEHDFACFIETFEKTDLKPGMIVETRSHDTFFVLDDCIVNNYDCRDLSEYDEKFINKYNPNYDIISVYKRNCNANLEEILELHCVDKVANVNKTEQ